jgi:hypothetical protein
MVGIDSSSDVRSSVTRSEACSLVGSREGLIAGFLGAAAVARLREELRRQPLGQVAD